MKRCTLLKIHLIGKRDRFCNQSIITKYVQNHRLKIVKQEQQNNF